MRDKTIVRMVLAGLGWLRNLGVWGLSEILG